MDQKKVYTLVLKSIGFGKLYIIIRLRHKNDYVILRTYKYLLYIEKCITILAKVLKLFMKCIKRYIFSVQIF